MFIIQYTSRTEGVTIGATGETMVEALSAMVEEFGDGFTVLYEHAHDELRQLVATIDGKPFTPPAAEEEATDAEGPFDVFTEGDEVDEDTDTDAGPVDRAGDEGADEGGGGGPADGGGDDDVAGAGGKVCAICGTSVSDDRAVVSELTYDEVRCKDCSA